MSAWLCLDEIVMNILHAHEWIQGSTLSRCKLSLPTYVFNLSLILDSGLYVESSRPKLTVGSMLSQVELFEVESFYVELLYVESLCTEVDEMRSCSP